MYGTTSIWGMIEWKLYSTENIWLKGDISAVYVWKRWIRINYSSHAPVLVLEEPVKMAEVNFRTNRDCWAFPKRLSKYLPNECKFCACTAPFGEKLHRSIVSYVMNCLFLGFGCGVLLSQISHGRSLYLCCSFHFPPFPFLSSKKLTWDLKVCMG